MFLLAYFSMFSLKKLDLLKRCNRVYKILVLSMHDLQKKCIRKPNEDTSFVS